MATKPQKAAAKKSKAKSESPAQHPANPQTPAKAKSSHAKSGSPKSSKSSAAPQPSKTRSGKKVQAASAVAGKKGGPSFVPRAVANLDDDDVLMAHGGGGTGFGRCGGRQLSSKLEQDLCNRLGMAGVVHSHSPRHYEIRFEDGKVAAYAPMIVLRGRGREGKGVVIEGVEEPDAPILRKIVSFRGQYGTEFYVILVGSDEVLDEAPLQAYDESCSAVNVNTLIARLAE